MDNHVEGLKVPLSTPLSLWDKKVGELWSTNNRVKVAHIDQPKWTFFGRLHFDPQGVLCPEIFTHASD